VSHRGLSSHENVGVSPQKQRGGSSTRCQQKQKGRFIHGSSARHGPSCSQVLPGSHGLDGDGWANAGVVKLVIMGADQATTAPAPMRLSILRREMPSCVSITSLSFSGTVHLLSTYRRLGSESLPTQRRAHRPTAGVWPYSMSYFSVFPLRPGLADADEECKRPTTVAGTVRASADRDEAGHPLSDPDACGLALELAVAPDTADRVERLRAAIVEQFGGIVPSGRCQVAETRISRRSLLKRVGTGAAVGWTAPVLSEVPARRLQICPRGPPAASATTSYRPVSAPRRPDRGGPT
jgi:hypothetical protein